MSLQSTTLRKIVVCVFAVIVEPIFASLPSRGGASWGPGKSDTKSMDASLMLFVFEGLGSGLGSFVNLMF